MKKWLGCLTLACSIASAEGSLLGAGGRYTKVVGMQGAVQNRASANSLYRQAMRDERESRRTHDPGLHKKAVREVRQARLADGQGRAFARAALQALAATMLAGQVNKSEAKDVDVDQLRQIAYQPNALEREMAELMDDRELDANDVGEASYASADETESPNAVEAKAEAKAEKTAAREPASLAPSVAASPGAPGAPLGGTEIAPRAVASPTTKALELPKLDTAANVNGGGGGVLSRNERADQIERDRRVFLKKLGVGRVPAAEVRADKDADIFAVVHTRYQIMRGENNFMEYLEHR